MRSRLFAYDRSWLVDGVGCLSPDVDQVPPAVGSQRRAHRIGVAQPLPIGERRVDQPPPGLGGDVIDVEDVVAVAADAVAIRVDEITRRSMDELGIGAAGLVGSDHRRRREAGDVQRAGGPKVNQGHGVHVAGHVDEPAAVDGHRDVVVAVPADRRRKAGQCPRRPRQRSRRDGHALLGVVESRELLIALRDQREANRIAGPDVGDVQRRHDRSWSSRVAGGGAISAGCLDRGVMRAGVRTGRIGAAGVAVRDGNVGAVADADRTGGIGGRGIARGDGGIRIPATASGSGRGCAGCARSGWPTGSRHRRQTDGSREHQNQLGAAHDLRHSEPRDL